MHKVGFVVVDGFQVMALAAQSAFEFANIVTGEPFYTITNYSLSGGVIRSSLGMQVNTEALDSAASANTWLVTGVNNPLVHHTDPALLAFIQRASSQARRMSAICTGAFFLAQAGILDHRRATTHWAVADSLQQQFPDIRVDGNSIFIIDGHVWTSAGMSAGIDLALAMVEKDLGSDIARSVARYLVMNQQRSGGQTQHSELLNLAPKSDRIQQALAYAQQHLRTALSVEQLATAVNLSPRHFSRIFRAETGKSPAKAVESLRLEAARLMIESSRHPLEVIARETGFRDRRHMREVFIRGFGVAPQILRQHSRAKE